jgi:hypothetical protein
MSLLVRRHFLRSRPVPPAPSQGPYHGPTPPRREPRMSPVMAACMLWVGAQQSGLSSRNDMTSNTLHGKA